MDFSRIVTFFKGCFAVIPIVIVIGIIIVLLIRRIEVTKYAKYAGRSKSTSSYGGDTSISITKDSYGGGYTGTINRTPYWSNTNEYVYFDVGGKIISFRGYNTWGDEEIEYNGYYTKTSDKIGVLKYKLFGKDDYGKYTYTIAENQALAQIEYSKQNNVRSKKERAIDMVGRFALIAGNIIMKFCMLYFTVLSAILQKNGFQIYPIVTLGSLSRCLTIELNEEFLGEKAAIIIAVTSMIIDTIALLLAGAPNIVIAIDVVITLGIIIIRKIS